MRCLLVEDYPPLMESLSDCLREEGYAVDVTRSGEEGLWFAKNQAYDVMILDIMLPEVDGLTILRQMRQLHSVTPILLISARDSVAQRVEGLDAGADDYLVKPFSLLEFTARVRALMRRRYASESPSIEVGGLTIDTTTKRVTRDGHEIQLTQREYALLEYLARRGGQVVSRTEIWDHVYEDSGGSSNVVDVYIGYLRKKLHEEGRAELIHTKRGFGYVLSDQPP